MHDIHEADKIQRIVLRTAQENGLKNVKEIIIELGSVVEHGADITAENLEFNLRMLCKGTMAAGAKIVIKKTKINGWKLASISGI
ncbi:hydrogenase maturation nickel metallochaperone HypA [Candidatus Falkowbacteria bacterium]|nr:hydrogenase maturation nickel metallochaperone HypA [Candidatus Falkowbacteria bacterium]